MKKQRFNQNWKVSRGVPDPFAEMMGEVAGEPVMLPHDGMIAEERSPDCPNGNQTGYYPCLSYTYTKVFEAPETGPEGQMLLEFEGVMQRAMVYLNGNCIARHTGGYSQFFADLRPWLQPGKNTLRVLALHGDRTSRWYPGSGIYRDVNLWTGGAVAVRPQSLRMTTRTLEADYAVVETDAVLTSVCPAHREVLLRVELQDPAGQVVAADETLATVPGQGRTPVHFRLTVSDPALWSPETPVLYTCRVVVQQTDGQPLDEAQATFGIRTLALDARHGLRINGQSVKLRGACIHHDNGILGACTLERAEEFRLRKLKEAGFNSIRSAHHPAGQAMLRVCDRLGLLVMDELSDTWDTPKNSQDFSFDFGSCWKQELDSMIAKDYNHPSVILYSLGNEMPEAGLPAGRMRARQLADRARRTDPTRYVTAGISGLLALKGMTPEEGASLVQVFGGGEAAAATAPAAPVTPTPEGSEGLNDVMGDLPLEARNFLNTMPPATRTMEEVSAALDVVGLNYMPARYLLEHQNHPDRVVVGSESYPVEIPHLWALVKQNNFVLGDFTWTGYDYLGEAGIGGFHYDKMPQGQGCYPDRLAYCGDINLNGVRRPMSYLRQIVFGLRNEPSLSVERVNRYGMGCVRNHWKYDDALDSWTFPGYEGRPARVKVLSPSAEVELFLNGVSLGRQPAGPEYDFTATYTLVYAPGTLTAVGYDGGRETGRTELHTAKTPAALQLTPNTETLTADGTDVLLLDLCLVDEDGTPNCWDNRPVTVKVDGPAWLAGLGSADPASLNRYTDSTCPTFDGHALAAVRTTAEPGSVTVTVTSPGLPDAVFVCENKAPRA